MKKLTATTSRPQEKSPLDFRLFLQSELVKRCQRNPKYSLRSFARMLNVSPSALSAMLNNKRPITESMKKRFAQSLGLGPDILRSFKDLSPKPSQKIKLRSEYKEFQQITLDSYAIISDWYHYAILEMLKLGSFKGDAKWIAKALDITQSEVNIAIERLQRLGLLEIMPDGTWVDQTLHFNATNISGELTSIASRKLQKQILEMSIKALEEVPIELRNHTSMTLAGSTKDLPRAKEKIKEFRRSFTQEMENNSNPDQVYHLGISFYPVTHIKD